MRISILQADTMRRRLPQALADTPPERAAWLLLVDQDAVVDDMSFNLPLRRYGDADLVLLGDQALVAGDQYRSRASLKLGEPLQGALAGRTLMPLMLRLSQ